MRKPKGKIDTVQDLLDCCDINKDSGCMEWKYWRHPLGYGLMRDGKGSKKTLMHRKAFKLSNPDADMTNLLVCHKCDNPCCCNPDHLFLGTPLDNTRDMINKGRGRWPGPKHPARGLKNSATKITDEQVKEIREQYKDPEVTLVMLGNKYGITFQQVSHIVNFKRRNT